MRARDNPFRTERILSVRYRLQEITWPELLQRCEVLHYRAALIGPRGSGKTTLLEDLAARLHNRGFGSRFIRLDEDRSVFEPGFVDQLVAGLAAQDILFFDGAEQMNALAWRWFQWRTRRVAGLIITTHKPGRLPTLFECRTSARLLAEIATELLGMNPGALDRPTDLLFKHHRGNLREALRDCYDLMTEENLLDR